MFRVAPFPVRASEEIEAKHGKAALRVGIPVTVTIPTRKRTALEYMFDPLVEAFSRSFRER